MTPKSMLCLGSCGSVIAALCCFTPLGVVALGAVGLGALVPAFDVILLPALAAFVSIAILGWVRLRRVKSAPPS